VIPLRRQLHDADSNRKTVEETLKAIREAAYKDRPEPPSNTGLHAAALSLFCAARRLESHSAIVAFGRSATGKIAIAAADRFSVPFAGHSAGKAERPQVLIGFPLAHQQKGGSAKPDLVGARGLRASLSK
jgi:hypothetical protein